MGGGAGGGRVWGGSCRVEREVGGRVSGSKAGV